MSTHLETELHRCRVLLPHAFHLFAQLFSRRRNVGVPLRGFIRNPQPAKICISVAVSEPAAHLKKRVVHLGISEEIARTKALKRQTTGKAIPADCDDP